MDILTTINDWFTVEAVKDKVAVRATVSNKPFHGYIGWVGYGNLGDEAVYQAIQQLFPKQHYQAFRTAVPARLASYLWRRPTPIASLALGGGTLINQSPQWLEEVKTALRRNIPTFCLGTGVAPSNSADTPPDSEEDLIHRWAKVLPEFVYAGVRGPMAQEYLRNAGYEAEIVGDTALALSTDKYTPAKQNKTIGINVSYGTDNIMHGDPDAFMGQVETFIRKVIADDFKVVIFPIWNGDLDASRNLVRSVNHPSIQLVERYGSVAEYLEAISQCEVFIGQKLHATIFATMLRIPSIMLEYRPKCLDYMQSIDMARYSIGTDAVTSEKLQALLNNLRANHTSVSRQLDAAILHYKRLQIEKAAYIQRSLTR